MSITVRQTILNAIHSDTSMPHTSQSLFYIVIHQQSYWDVRTQFVMNELKSFGRRARPEQRGPTGGVAGNVAAPNVK